MATSQDTTVRHAVSASDKQRAQLNKLLKDPSKPVFIPPPPKEKTIRPPREMMKNVQGSSAGAGSGEFHVYKENRRREYERIKLMEEESQQEAAKADFERRKREREEEADTKTAKNRARRQKKKDRAAGKPRQAVQATSDTVPDDGSSLSKKRRLVNEAALHLHRSEGDPVEDAAEDVSEGDPASNAGVAREGLIEREDLVQVTIHED